MTDRLGQQLGNYRLTRLLNQGSFAKVYLGEHTLLSTTIAVKVLHTQVTQEDVAQFQQEARLLASLKHPHIVRVLDFGIADQTPYLVMDYAPNGTLRTRHAKGTPLPLPTVVDYVQQVAGALQYAHDRKVVHRDVKPENMLIGEQNEILLSDFGIALVLRSLDHQSTKDMAGTIAYMAPEQISAHPCPASDQYALGIIAYEWLCGIRPFQGSYTEVAIKHSITPPPSPREHQPALSPDVEYVILTALAKKPEERFTSVSAFATALEQASQDMLPTGLSRSRAPSSPLPLSLNKGRPHLNTLVRGSLDLREDRRTAPLKVGNWSNLSANRCNTTNSIPSSHQPIVSRRAVLIGATGITAIILAGGGVLAFSQHHAQNHPFIYHGHSKTVNAVAWSPDGKQIASGSSDTTVQVWDASNGSHIFTYRGHTQDVWSVAWSPDGKQIASGSDDGTVQMWNASDGGDLFTYRGHFSGVSSVAWSPDGKRIASGSWDRTVRVWNASDGGNSFTYTGHSQGIWSVTWSPDGQQIASGSNDGTVQVWNASDGNKVLTYTQHTAVVSAVVWSPDGKRIASGSWDHTVQVWNASDGGNVFTYTGHSRGVVRVAWSPDGQRIASCCDDRIVQVWNASNGSNLFAYGGHSAGVIGVAWSPGGQWIASGSRDKTVQVWNEA